MELDIQAKSLSWKDNEIKISFYQNLAEKIVVKNENTEDLIELDIVKNIKDNDNLDDPTVEETENDYNEDIIQNDHLINHNINVQSENPNVGCIETIENKDTPTLINEPTKMELPKSSLR